MNMLPDIETIQDVATILQTDAAFIEKDWYVSRVIYALSEFEDEQFEAIFCGGTSLMKGYKIIQRFSEDVDFKIIPKINTIPNRTDKRNYRNRLIVYLSDLSDLTFDTKNMISRDASNFFGIQAQYPKQFGEHNSMRSRLKLEGSFVTSVSHEPIYKVIKPIIGDYTSTSIECSIKCISLLETSADKASALVWRVLKRNSQEQDYDPSVIRHLYDLHALIENIDDLGLLKEKASDIYDDDKSRGSLNAPQIYAEALVEVINILEQDERFYQEYQNYALNMCFGIKKPPAYQEAIKALKSLNDKTL